MAVPISKSYSTTSKEIDKPAGAVADFRILVVDDDQNLRQILATLLGKHGYEVCQKEDALDLLNTVKRKRPDLILLDGILPGKDGFHALQELRQAYREEELPVIMLTGCSTREDAVRGFRLGANDYLVKPPDVDLILQRMNTQLQMHRGKGNRRIGKYELRERIGSGGMAYVYRAYDRELDMEVALKLVHREYSDDIEFIDRLRHEADVMARVNHPNVVQFFCLEEVGSTVAISMELLVGQTLRGLVLPEKCVARIGRDAALGLAALHQAGLVHRDIKPENIFLTQGGETKILDLGIAIAEDELRKTQIGKLVGTPIYMSPERLIGEVLLGGDGYALGCVLFELLAGEPAFKPCLDHKSLIRAKCEPPQELLKKIDTLSVRMNQILSDLLQPSISRRPQNLRDVAQRLAEFADDTIEFPPLSVKGKITKSVTL